MQPSQNTSGNPQSADGLERVHGAATRLRNTLARVLIGQHGVVEALCATAFAGGHALLEGVPGLGKTWLAQNFARAVGLGYRRIQFTPDLMPADITGTQVIESETTASGNSLRYRFQRGPVFTELLLADEINRATPKTQSALLEAMQEGAVTVAGERHALPQPFMVIATQNPLEMEGTYVLPEAQLDRFLARIVVERPDAETLKNILMAGDIAAVGSVIDGDTLLFARQVTKAVPVSGPMYDYIVRLVEATHGHSALRLGLSPRGAQSLLALARAFALMRGNPFVSSEDVRRALPLAALHRLVLSFEAELENRSASTILAEIANQVKA
jgi:MoxR-like ATPase